MRVTVIFLSRQVRAAMAEALRYKDKVTIVTGGSSGIGRGCVEVFGKHDIP